MKITFISNYFPYPPDNGVSLPIFNLLKGLSETHEIFYLYLNDGTNGFLSDELKLVISDIINIEEVTVTRLSKPRRILGELLLLEPYFHGYDLQDVDVPKKAKEADAYFFSPFTALAFAKSKALNKNALKVAWINDSTTAMMRSRINYLGMKGIPITKKMYFVSQWLRSLYMGRLEATSLSTSDLIFVQTETEKCWIDRISNGELNKKVRVVTNGVNDILFQLETVPGKPTFLFFGEMSGVYNDLVIWLLKNVWPILRNTVQDSVFRLVGKNASDNVLSIVKKDPRIQYQSYVENIEDVFSERGVMLAPVFKDFGVINKVLESMAAGVPVVGDRTAFNGISGFQSGTHGLVADSSEKMAESAKRLIDDVAFYETVSARARLLMQENFSWVTRIEVVDHSLRDARRVRV